MSAGSKTGYTLHGQVAVKEYKTISTDVEDILGALDTADWANVESVSCGDHHTVALLSDGSLKATGLNANGECDVKAIADEVESVSCGRYHTAVLLKNGSVIIKGKTECHARGIDDSGRFSIEPVDFPLVFDLIIKLKMPNYQEMNQLIENIKVGDKLIIESKGKKKPIIEVLNSEHKKIGEMQTKNDNAISSMIDKISAEAAEVVPLSQKSKRSKFASMKVRLNYILSEEEKGDSTFTKGMYEQTPISEWPPVVKIKSLVDAVAGITADGQILVSGYCPCAIEEIKKYLTE